ncbi:MAG: putative sulfate exporter family transporter [Bdellovibrionales bacterium]|nr:putative sulfate exporter family transporter [Bdellovibrionales bacterium]
MKHIPKVVVAALFALCFSPGISSALALVMGMVCAFTLGQPFEPSNAKKFQTYLLQASVVGLGAGMNLVEILKQGATSIPMTLIALTLIMTAGMLLTRALKLSTNLGWLLSSGTAICGGSAIAALSPVIRARDEEISMSMGVVFLLNSIALLIFPVIGAHLGMNQHEFGLFAALAIHDTSSVVGAAGQYGAEALNVATTTKLVRALWIAPLCLVIATYMKSHAGAAPDGTLAKVSFPRFILFFIAMSAFVTWVWPLPIVYTLAKRSLVASIFLIGLGFSLKNLKAVGTKALAAAVILWMFSISVSWIAIHFN